MSRTLYPLPASVGTVWIVDPVNGSDTGTGTVTASIGGAVGKASPGDRIVILPGGYDEAVVVPANKPRLTLEGLGGRGATFIEPSETDATGLTVHADDTTVINLGAAAENDTTPAALVVTGARFRAYRSKFEGGLQQVLLGPGTDAQITAGTRGDGADALFDDCEFCWGVDGIVVQCTDYGAVTQARIRNCLFHNLSGDHITEAVGSGGSAGVGFRNLWVEGCTHDGDEDQTAPTAFIDLDADNANTGLVTGCRYAYATNEADVIALSTGILYVANMTEAGVTTARPS